MFEGYVSFAGTEVINAARVKAYADAGFAPQGVRVEPCVVCDTLPEALGDGAYNTPLVDAPPWFDTEHPGSSDFAGLVPLGMTGLRGSTRNVEVVERAGDGGIPLPGRATSRTIAVSALAVARTAEGLDAGINWLASVLHPPCATELPGCGGATLDMFSTCPVTCEGQTDPQGPVLNWPVSMEYGWSGINGTPEVASGIWTNRVKNPSFEVDLTGWTASAWIGAEVDPAVHWVGANSARLYVNQDTPQALTIHTATGTAGMPVTAGDDYQCWVRVERGSIWSSPAGVEATVKVTYYDTGGVAISTDTLDRTPLIGPGLGDWQAAGGQTIAPPGAVTASMMLTVDGPTTPTPGCSVNVDGAFFAEAAAPYDYFDGDNEDTAEVQFAWTGTPHASTSTVTGADEGTFETLDPERPGYWIGPVQEGVCDDVTVVWRLRRVHSETTLVTNHVGVPSAEAGLGPDDDGNSWGAGPIVAGAPDRTNLAIYPGVEIDGGADHWPLWRNTNDITLIRSDVSPIGGGWSMLATVDVAATFPSAYCQPNVPIAPGQTVTFGYDVRTEQPLRQAQLRPAFFDSTGAFISQSTSPQTVLTAGAVTRIVFSAVAPAGAASTAYSLDVWPAAGGADMAVGERVWFDNFSSEVGDGPTDGSYFDGSTPNTSAFRYEWTGAPNASPSTRSPLSAGGSYAGRADVSVSTEQALVGTSSIKVQWPASDARADAVMLGVPLERGRQYNASMSVFVPAGDPDVNLSVLFATNEVRVTTKGQWVRVNVPFRVPNAVPPGQQWDQVNPGVQWDGVDPAVTWDQWDPPPQPPRMFIVCGTTLNSPSTGGRCYIDAVQVTDGALVTDYFDGSFADTAARTYEWLGTPGLSKSTREGIGPLSVRTVLTDKVGTALVYGPSAIVEDDVVVLTQSVPMSPNFPDPWRPALVVQGGTVLGGTVSILRRQVLTTADCIADLKRSLHGVVTIAGPTVVEEFAEFDGDVTMARVEWTWVATRPFVYADPVPLFTRLPYSGSGRGDYVDGSVIAYPSEEVSQGATSCLVQPPSLDTCADYPCCTNIALPPAAPSIPDPCTPNIGSAPYVRRAFVLTPSGVPAGVGVVNMAFEAVGKPVVGVRVRLWEVTDPSYEVVECQFVNEWWIDYVPTDGVLVIDSRAGTIETYCQNQFRPAQRVVRGPYRAAFAFPEVGCNHTYRLTVDTPKSYAAGCPDPGGVQGSLFVSASLVVREG